jgi:hypothetical protein
MFSHPRSQGKRAPKFCHLISIACCSFNTSPHKKISRLRSNKSWWRNNFFTHLIHFLYQSLKQFPRVSICSVSKIQYSNGKVSTYRLISKLISASFMQQNDATAWCGSVVFVLQCRDCSQSVHTVWSLSRQPKDCIRGPEAYPSCSMTCIWQRWHVEASTGWILGGHSGSQ